MNPKLTIFIGVLTFASLGGGLAYLIQSKEVIDPVPGSCTIFSVALGEKVLFGNNEDYYQPNTYLWTEPATKGNYGAIYVGFEEHAHQGGINEKGLCFDANALPASGIRLHEELAPPPMYDAPYEAYMMWLPVFLLRKAVTVEEAIELASRYQRTNWYPNDGTIKYQLNVADALGDAVVMSIDETGELAFTRKQAGEPYLISTNYNKANPENALEYPCQRYTTAEAMLRAMDSESDLSVEYVKSILEAVHQEGVVSSDLVFQHLRPDQWQDLPIPLASI
jgi:hypothetical protein